MNTQTARVTLKEAAALTGVSTRTVLRWRAAGLLMVEYRPITGPEGTPPVSYDLEEVMAAPARWKAYRAARVRMSPE